jgi:hypothetical protein
MEELVRSMNPEDLPLLDDDASADDEGNGPIESRDEAERAPTRSADSTES